VFNPPRFGLEIVAAGVETGRISINPQFERITSAPLGGEHSTCKSTLPRLLVELPRPAAAPPPAFP